MEFNSTLMKLSSLCSWTILCFDLDSKFWNTHEKLADFEPIQIPIGLCWTETDDVARGIIETISISNNQ